MKILGKADTIVFCFYFQGLRPATLYDVRLENCVKLKESQAKINAKFNMSEVVCISNKEEVLVNIASKFVNGGGLERPG